MFEILNDATPIGEIRLTRPFRNRNEITIPGQNSWTFRKHLFTVLYSGVSNAATDIWIVAHPGSSGTSLSGLATPAERC